MAPQKTEPTSAETQSHPEIITAICDLCESPHAYLVPAGERTIDGDRAHLQLLGWEFLGGFAAYCPSCAKDPGRILS